MKIGISVLAIIFLFVSGSVLQAEDFLRVKVLSKNVRPGDAVIVEVGSDYEIKEAALIYGNRRLPCFTYKKRWLCAVGVPSDFRDKDNLFVVPIDVKTEFYWHMTQIEVKIEKKSVS